MTNPFTTAAHFVQLLEGLHSMTPADALPLVKAHPDTAGKLLVALADVVSKDQTFIPALVTAIETKNYTGFAFTHLGVLLGLGNIIRDNPALQQQLAAVASKG